MSTLYLANFFMEKVYEESRHGDDKHQKWLKEKLTGFVPYLEGMFRDVYNDAFQRGEDYKAGEYT